MLEYLGVEYVDRRIKTLEEWEEAKDSLGLAFPVLPYYIDGGGWGITPLEP